MYKDHKMINLSAVNFDLIPRANNDHDVRDNSMEIDDLNYRSKTLMHHKSISKLQCSFLVTQAENWWRSPEHPHDAVAWAHSRFDLTVHEKYTYEYLENAYKREASLAVWIYMHARKNNMIGEENIETITFEKRLSCIMQLVSTSYHMLQSFQIMRNLKLNHVEHILPPETYMFRWSIFDKKGINEVEEVIIFVLSKLFEAGYKKYKQDQPGKSYCYQEIKYKDYGTRSWAQKILIEDFVIGVCSKESNFKQWTNLHKSSRVIKDVTCYLEKCNDQEFPFFQPSRYKFSFRNGIFDIENLTFYSYEEVIDPNLTTCNFHDVEFPEQHLGDPEEWYEIPTPAIQSIFDMQKMGLENERKEICKYLYAFLGRLYFEMNIYDRWQVAPFIKGIAGSGKSTLGKNAKHMYKHEDTAVLSSNIERNFGLAPYADKYILVCLEMKKGFSLPQADIQSMITGEEMNLAEKFKNATTKVWKVPAIFFGNEVADFVDAQGSMVRRFLQWEFTKPVINSDPMLDNKLKDETGFYLLKSVLAYRMLALKYGTKDLWEIPTLPKYFLETKKRLQIQLNPLVAFIMDDEKFVIDAKRKIHMKEFQEDYNRWLRANHFPTNIRFDHDHYDSVFQQYGITVVKDLFLWNKTLVHGYFTVGIGYVGENAYDLLEPGNEQDVQENMDQIHTLETTQ